MAYSDANQLLFVAGPPFSLDDAMDELKGVAEKWTLVGGQLYIPDTVIGAIALESAPDVLKCLRKILQYWVQRDPNASWRRLIRRFDRSADPDLHRVADHVRNFAEELTGQCCSAVPYLLYEVGVNLGLPG